MLRRARRCLGLGMLGLLSLGLVLGGSIDVAEARSAHPHFSDGGTLDWALRLSVAKEWAQSQGKVIFVEVGNPRCPNCRTLCANVLPDSRCRNRMKAAAVGLAADSRNLHRSVRSLFLNNVPRSELRVLPWAAFLNADGTWITGWGGYTSTATLLRHLSIAEARLAAAQPRAVDPQPSAPRTGEAGAVPPAPDATPEPDVRRKVLLSSKSGEGKCLGGNCGDGACADGSCIAPGACADGSCADGSCKPPDGVFGPMLPWVRGQLPKPEEDKTAEKAPMASKSEDLYAVGSPDAQPIVLAPGATLLPPPTVRRVERAPTPDVPPTWHPSCDAGDLLTGDPDAEFVLRTPAAPTRVAAPTASPTPSATMERQIDAVVAAARNGDAVEAERLLYAALREARATDSAQTVGLGRDALKDWREMSLMPPTSLVRKHVVSQARSRYAGTRWTKLFE